MSQELLNKTEIDVNDPELDCLLANLQANILKYHGRRHAWHVFLAFSPGKTDTASEWIRRYAYRVTSAKTQLKDTARRKKDLAYDGGTVICFFMTKNGYQYFGYNPGNIGGGLVSMSESAARLSDPPPETWQCMYRAEIHVMVLLADTNKHQLQKELDLITLQTKDLLQAPPNVQKGESLHNPDGVSIEHFGYADGISQPRFLKEETTDGKLWNDNEALQMAIVEERIPNHKDCYGSFLVFRKLEQNVQLFREKTNELAGLLFPDHKDENALKLAGAYVVGRFPNGTPVVKHPAEIPPQADKKFDNDFDYSHDPRGAKCPYHSHTRITCPRDIRQGWLTRIVRRGIPYDEAGRNSDMQWHPEKGVGLLFMCYQSNIGKQFERLQADWANAGEIQPTRQTAMDGLVGQGDNARPQHWPSHWDGHNTVDSFRFSGAVTLKGGAYFFAPSLPFLRLMGPFATE